MKNAEIQTPCTCNATPKRSEHGNFSITQHKIDCEMVQQAMKKDQRSPADEEEKAAG